MLKQSVSEALSVTLRPAGAEDEEFLFVVYASTRAEEMALLGGWDERQKEAFLRMQFILQRQAYAMQYPQAEHRIILRAGRDAGRIIVWQTADEVRLVDITLLPEERSAGIGAAIIINLLTEAHQAGKPVRLHVAKENPARRLYERLGFVTVGEYGATHFLMESAPP